ncbi:hypothetical protein AB685_04510 [Bacillus sp. LL01]|nr:hypothetical protein AB685_04510 [Bacillus sp. LL01]
MKSFFLPEPLQVPHKVFSAIPYQPPSKWILALLSPNLSANNILTIDLIQYIPRCANLLIITKDCFPTNTKKVFLPLGKEYFFVQAQGAPCLS